MNHPVRFELPGTLIHPNVMIGAVDSVAGASGGTAGMNHAEASNEIHADSKSDSIAVSRPTT